MTPNLVLSPPLHITPPTSSRPFSPLTPSRLLSRPLAKGGAVVQIMIILVFPASPPSFDPSLHPITRIELYASLRS